MFYLPFFKISPSSWVLTNFLTSVCIPNETHISQYLKLASINERKYNVCHFGPYHDQTVYRSVHFAIVFVIGFSSHATRWNTYLTPLSGPRICHYVAYGLYGRTYNYYSDKWYNIKTVPNDLSFIMPIDYCHRLKTYHWFFCNR